MEPRAAAPPASPLAWGELDCSSEVRGECWERELRLLLPSGMASSLQPGPSLPRRIRAGTELTWDYNYEVGSVEGKELLCCCGAIECRGRLL